MQVSHHLVPKIQILGDGWKCAHLRPKKNVHLVLEIPPNQSVSFVVGFLKGRSAIKIFDRYKDCAKNTGACISDRQAIL